MFANIPAYPPADLKVVVRVNFDTLYSIAWLDLTKEPQIVSAPDSHGRFYLLPSDALKGKWNPPAVTRTPTASPISAQ